MANEPVTTRTHLHSSHEGNLVSYTRTGGAAAIALAGAVLLSSCATNENGPSTPSEGALSGSLIGSGASSQEKAQAEWITRFQLANDDQVTVEYTAGGSGAGRTDFLSGKVDFVGSDRAFKIGEAVFENDGVCVPEAGIVEFPAYISPIAIGFNLEGIETLNLDAATIAGIFSNQIANWNDPAIAALNPDATLPDLEITPIHRSTNSGTTENFVAYLAAAAPDVWTWEVSGDWPEDLVQGQDARAETGDVAEGLGINGTIGYIDASRAPGTTAAVQVGDAFVAYSPEGAAAVVDASPLEDGRADGDVAVALDRSTTAAGAYPIVLVSYLIGCADYQDDATATLVKAFFDYVVSTEGQATAAEAAGSAPLSESIAAQASAAIALIQ